MEGYFKGRRRTHHKSTTGDLSTIMNSEWHKFDGLLFEGEAEEALLSREGADPQLVTRLPVLVRHEEARGEK